MQWEYRVESVGIEHGEIEEACMAAGELHWELAAAIVVEATRDEWRTRLIFKRPVPEERAREVFGA